MVSNPPANTGGIRDLGLIPCTPEGGNDNSLEYSCLKNPMDRGARQAIIHRVPKSWTRLKWCGMHNQTPLFISVFFLFLRGNHFPQIAMCFSHLTFCTFISYVSIYNMWYFCVTFYINIILNGSFSTSFLPLIIMLLRFLYLDRMWIIELVV